MSATLALIRFELERRWLALAMGAAIGVLVVLVPWFPGVHTDAPAELRSITASLSALCFATLLALALGSSLLGGDLAERRAGFWFARPLGAAALVGGRLAAALALLLGATGLALLPSILAGAPPELPLAGDLLFGLGWTAFVAVGATIALLLAAVATLAARARTPWILLELGVVVGLGLVVLAAVRAFRALELGALETVLWSGLVVAALAALVAAFAVASARGRTDLALAHRAQAIALALALGLTAAGVQAWSRARLNPSFDEILASASAQSLDDDVFVVGGADRTWDVPARFLYDATSGATVRAGREPRVDASTPIAVANGAYFWFDRAHGASQLVRATREGGKFHPAPTRVDLDGSPGLWTVSSDGERLATLAPSADGRSLTLGLREIARGAVLRVERLPLARLWHCRLLAEGDGFRVLTFADGERELASWRVERDGRPVRTGSAAAATDGLRIADAERGRLYRRATSGAHAWVVADLATLAPIAELRPPLLDEPESALSALFAIFEDGSVGVSARRAGEREIARYSPAGELLGAWRHPTAHSAQLVATGARFSVVLATREERGGSAEGWLLERFDFTTGERREVGRGVAPLPRPLAAPAGPSLLRDADGRLFLLDPDAGTTRPAADPR